MVLPLLKKSPGTGYRRLSVLIILVLLIFIFEISLTRYLADDECEALHTAWKIGEGQRIYTDFFQHHHSFFYYTLIPVIKIFGETAETILMARIFVFLFVAGILGITYLLTETAFGRTAGILAVIILPSTAMFTDFAVAIRPDVPQVFFTLSAIWLLIQYRNDHNRKLPLILSAVSLGIAFLFLQKAVLPMILILGIIGFALIKKKIPWSDGLTYVSALVMTVLPYYLLLAATGAFRDYFVTNWLLNFKMELPRSASPLEPVSYLALSSPGLFFLYPLGLFRLKNNAQRTIAWLSSGMIFLLVALRFGYQYYMLAVILVVIIAANVIYRLGRKNPWLAGTLLLLSVVPSWVTLVVVTARNPMDPWLSKIMYVTYLTDRADSIYDGRPRFNYYRRDIDYFWFSQEYTLSAYRLFYPYDYDIYRLIAENEPKFISGYLIDIDQPVIKNRYERSDVFNDLLIRRERVNSE